MSKATEAALATLHGAVAETLTAQVTHETEELTFDEDGNPEHSDVMVRSASPATLAAAIKFLKDNSITCEIGENTNMNNLRSELAKKQKRSRMTDATIAAQQLQ
jgi:hypothetical protein